MKRITKIVSLVLAAMMILSIQMPLASAKPRISQKSKPTLTLTSKNATSISLKWKEFGDADGYTIYRKTSKNGKWKSIKTTSATSYTNKKLKLNKTYWYKVRAFEMSGKSKVYPPYSKVKYTKPKLPKPTIKFSGVSANSVKISISKPQGADGVIVYRRTSKNGKWKKLKQTTTKTYTNKSLKYKKTYYYKAKAYKKIGKKYYYSAYTSQTKTKTYVRRVNPTTSNTQIHTVFYLKWGEVYGATKYRVYVEGANGKYKYLGTTTKTSYRVTIPTSGRYNYKVRAIQKSGKKSYYSSYSKTVTYMFFRDNFGDSYETIVCPPNRPLDVHIGELDIKGGPSVVRDLDFGGKTFTMAIDQHSQYHTDSFNDTVDAFEKKFNCKIKLKELNFSTYNQQISELISSGNSPEICYVHGSMFPDCAIKKLYNPLNDHLRIGDMLDESNPTAGGIDTNKTSYFVYKDKIYGTCNYESCYPYVIYYNKKQMADAGFSGNKDPRVLAERTNNWTWELIQNMGRKLTTSDVYFLSNSFTGRGLPLSFGGNTVTVKNGVYRENVSSQQYMEAMKLMQSLAYGANAITEPRDSAHAYNSYVTLLKGSAYLWTEETSKYLDISKEVKTSTAFGRSKDNIGITTVPLGSTNTKKAYPTGFLTAVASGKGTDPRVAVAWDVFRSGYKDPVIDSNELDDEDQAFADGLIKGDICFEIGSFGTSDTTTLTLTEGGVVSKVIRGDDVAKCINEVKDQMTACINHTLGLN